MTGVLLAVDGNNLLHRSHHALAATGLTHLGMPVHGVHGLLTALATNVRRVGATHLLVAFDPDGGCPTRRAKLPTYKADRGETPGEVAEQLRIARSVLDDAGIGATVIDGWEADDVLASAAGTGRTHLLSGDRDLIQSIRPGRTVLLPDGTELDTEAVIAKHGVTPEQYPHLAALRGEPGDGIGGVSGIGKVAATRLVTTFGSVEATLRATREQLIDAAGTRAANAITTGGAAATVALEVGRLRDDLDVGTGVALRDLSATTIISACERYGLVRAGRVVAALAGRE